MWNWEGTRGRLESNSGDGWMRRRRKVAERCLLRREGKFAGSAERISIVEKSSVVGNDNKVRSESMVGEEKEEELVRKKTKTLNIASERRRETKSKSPFSSSSGAGGEGVNKSSRRSPLMLSKPPTKKPAFSGVFELVAEDEEIDSSVHVFSILGAKS